MKSSLSFKAFALLGALMIAAPALSFAQTTTSAPKNTINVACIQSAVEKRETAIITSFGTFNTSVTTALTARKDALKNVYTLATKNERAAARKTAFETYRTANRTAHETLKKSRKAAWDTFNTEAKTCKVVEEQAPKAFGAESSVNL